MSVDKVEIIFRNFSHATRMTHNRIVELVIKTNATVVAAVDSDCSTGGQFSYFTMCNIHFYLNFES